MKWRAFAREEPQATRPARATFEGLVLPHLDAGHNLARWLVRDPTVAEDVVQDAAVRAIRYFPSYRGGDARAWWLQIVRNTAYDTMAHRKKNEAASLDASGPADDGPALQVPDGADDPEMALHGRERLAELDRALGALPVELRECLVLHELEELSYKEIAGITGTPIGTVMSRLWRARQALTRGKLAGGKAEGATQ